VIWLRGALGVVLLLAFAWLLSNNRRKFPVRTVVWGLVLELILALLIFRLPQGQSALQAISEVVLKFTSFSAKGAQMVFGSLANESSGAWGYVFAFNALPMIIYFSAVMSILYYLGIMQVVVWVISRAMTGLMRTSGAETLTVASNIFVGQTEAPLVAKPYVPTMTRSEIMAMMTGGFGTIAGSVMVVYMRFVGEEYARHLISASFMAAPAALIFAKIMFPETEPSATGGKVPLRFDRQGTNLLEAIALGVTDGLMLALNVGAMLIAFVALIWLIDWPLNAMGTSLDQALGVVFTPFAWIMGVENRDLGLVGGLLGKKIAANEFLAYLQLKGQMAQLTPRSVIIATFMLCGFANLSSIGIQIGGIGAIAPTRKTDLAQVALRAMVAGALTSLLTATFAGMFARI
jgi:CNT family concentrative nucleoside transporter